MAKYAWWWRNYYFREVVFIQVEQVKNALEMLKAAIGAMEEAIKLNASPEDDVVSTGSSRGWNG